MHRYTDETEKLVRAIVDYAVERIRLDPPPLDGPRTEAELEAAAGQTITEEGLGGEEALRIFAEQLAPATVSSDHPRYWAFITDAPTKAAQMFDLVVGASSISGAAWIEAAGAIYAENQALRWLADLAGLPASAGGVFVTGGSAGNLSALVAARHAAAERRERPARWSIATTDYAHSSVWSTARIMDVDVLPVPGDERGRLTGERLASTLDESGTDELFAVVATAGTTNPGVVDDLAGVAEVCRERGLWYHVDGAYGGALLAAPSVRRLFDGIEDADSLIIDPHKLLFSPFDCAALLYRDPAVAARAHMQEAEYLEDANVAPGWNPMHYAYHMSRRARGLPFWFSLATHGTIAYSDALEGLLQLTREAADEIRRRDDTELVLEPELTVVLFRRPGWSDDDYRGWSDRLLAEEVAFVLPTTWKGERLMRFCFVNPNTTIDDVRTVLDTLG